MSAPLVDPESVRAVSGTVLTDDVLDLLIDDAHGVLDGLYADVDPPVPSPTWESVERYLSAHLAYLRDATMRITSDHTGASSVSLDKSDFLAMAIAMDPTGKLKQRYDKTGYRPVLQVAQTTRGGPQPPFPFR